MEISFLYIGLGEKKGRRGDYENSHLGQNKEEPKLKQRLSSQRQGICSGGMGDYFS
jgi:hypothetical protein